MGQAKNLSGGPFLHLHFFLHGSLVAQPLLLTTGFPPLLFLPAARVERT